MEYDEIIESRLSVLESRIAAVEQQLFVLTRGGAIRKRRQREYTPEERKAIRERLVAGQERARARREEEAQQADEPDTKVKKEK